MSYPANMMGGSGLCEFEDSNVSVVEMGTGTGGNSTSIPGASAMSLYSSLGVSMVSLMAGIIMFLN